MVAALLLLLPCVVQDEQRWLPEERLKRMHALRPTILMGSQAVEHPLKEFIIARMSENLRKQVGGTPPSSRRIQAARESRRVACAAHCVA